MKKLLVPVMAFLIVAGCAGFSLAGYEAPVYVTKEKQEETTKDEQAETELIKGNFDLENGVYQGTGNGFRGKITVAVEIQDHSIRSIDVLSHKDDVAFFNRAKEIIENIIKTQNIEVDTISGATYSSKGIINAVKNALTGEEDTSNVGNPGTGQGGYSDIQVEDIEEPSGYKDGTYYGTGNGFGGPLKVKVVVKEGKIASVSIVSHSDDQSFISKASVLTKKIVSKQSTNVDTISGATYSSVGIVEAVRDALGQAAATGEDTETQPEQDAVTGTVPYVEGIYYGTAEGYQSDITVAVVIQDYTIKAILVSEHGDDEAFFGRAMEVVKNVIKQQNTEVDTVSGATYSSEGLLNAIKNALLEAEKVTSGEITIEEPDTTALKAAIAEAKFLDKDSFTAVSWAVLEIRLQDAIEALSYTIQEFIDRAEKNLRDAIEGLVELGSEDEKEESITKYIDGTYEGTAVCLPDEYEEFIAYNLSLKIVIQNDRIIAISDILGDGDSSNDNYIKRAASGTSSITGVVDQILNNNGVENVDTVSRATCTSKAIIEACEKALASALLEEMTEAEE